MARHAVITGGSGGIGQAIAAALGGYKIWITGRSAEKGAAAVAALKEAGVTDVTFLVADFTARADIARLTQTLIAQLGGKLDVLVHSTGVLNAKRTVSADGIEETWASQFLGRYLLTEALTPLLAATPDSRVVFVGAPVMKSAKIFEADLSLAENYSMLRAAQQTALACHLYVQTYAAAHPHGPTINVGHVGLAATGILRATGPFRIPVGLLTSLFGIPPARAAKNFIAMASAPELKGVTGYFFPKPERLDKREKISYPDTDLALFQRVAAKTLASS